MMNLIGNLLGITEEYLKLRNKREDRKYLDRLINLKRELYEEENKPDDIIDHARIDNIYNELRILLESITTLGKQDSKA